MLFLLQKENKYQLDNQILESLIKNEKYTHEYIPIKMEDFHNAELKTKDRWKQGVPQGTIEFVTEYFRIFWGIDQMNPIEIPPCLRTEEFLKRKYSIVEAKNIPQDGEFFIKDASELKVFSYAGELSRLLYDGIFDEPKPYDTSMHMDRNHLYQVSELVNILSESRVYIIDGNIHCIANYNGDPCIFPDTDLIKKADRIYSMQKDYPKSYTMDVMVTDRGTAIVEIHIMFSCGLYQNNLGTSFLYGYRDAKDYTVKHNTKIKEFSNF